MGVIKKQAIRGSFWSYAGVALGFINIGILSPRFFTTDEVGLTQVLLSYATLFSQIGTLGMGSIAIRLFPEFRSEGKKHNGFVALSILVGFVGFIIMTLIALVFQPLFVSSGVEGSDLLINNYKYVIPLTFFYLFFALFDSYNQMLYNAVLGTFLKEFVLRISNTILIVLFFLNVITFQEYVFLFVIVQSIPFIVITFFLYFNNQMTFTFKFSFFKERKGLLNEAVSLSVFGIISGLSSMLLLNIDKLMLNQYIGLKAAGVYSIAFFFGTLILIPQRSISKISISVISDSWKRNDINTIDIINKKSSINQFLLGSLIFIGVWSNIDNVFKILTPEYEAGKWVIFFIGLSNVLAALAGSCIYILMSSKYYRSSLWLSATSILLVVITNFVFIPIWGLTGAAIANLVSNSLNSLLLCLFVYWKFKIQPLDKKHIWIIFSSIITYFLISFLRPVSIFWIDIIIRSSLISAIFISICYFSKASEDVNTIIDKIIKRIMKVLKFK